MTDQRLMKAVVLEKRGLKPEIVVQQVPIPEPGHDQVLVRIDSSPINPSDLKNIKGWYDHASPVPAIPGFEGSGTIVAAGSDSAAQSLIGKRVACLSEVRSSSGCWAEYLLTRAKNCFVITDDVTLEEASCFCINPLTVVMFLELIQDGGHRAVIQNAAASALGKMLIKSLKRLNIPIINIVRRQEQVVALTAIGAEYVLDSSQEGFTERLHELSQQLNATVAFDAIAGEATGVVFSAIQPGGTVYVYGILSGSQCSDISVFDLMTKSKNLKGAWITSWLAKKSSDYAPFTVLEHLKTDLSTDIIARFPLDSISEAIALYQSDMSSGKVIIKA